MAIVPITTRLRWISSKDPESLQSFLEGLSFRVRIWSINHDGKKWFLWFVPPEDGLKDVISGDID